MAVIRGALLCRYQNDTECGSRTINCCGSGILDDRDACDIIWVHIFNISDSTVNKGERSGIGVVDGCESSDVELAGTARRTRLGGDVEPRDRTLEHCHKVV